MRFFLFAHNPIKYKLFLNRSICPQRWSCVLALCPFSFALLFGLKTHLMFLVYCSIVCANLSFFSPCWLCDPVFMDNGIIPISTNRDAQIVDSLEGGPSDSWDILTGAITLTQNGPDSKSNERVLSLDLQNWSLTI